jgi:hypothetical protein
LVTSSSSDRADAFDLGDRMPCRRAVPPLPRRQPGRSPKTRCHRDAARHTRHATLPPVRGSAIAGARPGHSRGSPRRATTPVAVDRAARSRRLGARHVERCERRQSPRTSNPRSARRTERPRPAADSRAHAGKLLQCPRTRPGRRSASARHRSRQSFARRRCRHRAPKRF